MGPALGALCLLQTVNPFRSFHNEEIDGNVQDCESEGASGCRVLILEPGVAVSNRVGAGGDTGKNA